MVYRIGIDLIRSHCCDSGETFQNFRNAKMDEDVKIVMKYAKIKYTILFTLSFIAGYILKQYSLQLASSSLVQNCSIPCLQHLIIYKIAFTLVLFHSFLFLVSLITIKNLWFIEIFVFVGIGIGVFFIPIEAFTEFKIPAYIASIIFLLLQSLLLVGLAQDTAINVLESIENDTGPEGYSIIKKAGMIFVTVLFVCASISVSAVLLVYYSFCTLNILVVVIHLITIFGMYVCSILRVVQKHDPSSGLLQSSSLSAYNTYIIASSVINSPICGVSSGTSATIEIIGSIITILSIGKAAFSSAQGIKTFHIVFICASFYLSCVMVNWTDFSTQDLKIGVNQGVEAVWIKVATSWANALLYFWILFAPIILKNRDFS